MGPKRDREEYHPSEKKILENQFTKIFMEKKQIVFL